MFIVINCTMHVYFKLWLIGLMGAPVAMIIFCFIKSSADIRKLISNNIMIYLAIQGSIVYHEWVKFIISKLLLIKSQMLLMSAYN